MPNNGAEKELRVMTSMSAYYHTPMGDILVGAFAAVGFFMIAYSGHDAIDNWVSGEFRREVQHPGQICYGSDTQRETVLSCQITRI